MSDPDLAQLISAGALALLTAGMALAGRTDVVAAGDGEYTPPDGVERKVTAGTVVPAADVGHLGTGVPTRRQRRSALGAVLAGKDHRASTSKTVVFAWTLAIAFGLLSLIVCVLLGDSSPWDTQVGHGLQPEYLLLLGGPYAAAVLAKYAAASKGDVKTTAGVGDAKPTQLVADDAGNTDLGDFQYVLFNAVALVFFLGTFVGDLGGGFPDLPPILTGLVLTSAGGYSAKKLLVAGTPTLISVVPAAAEPGARVHVFGTNLVCPGAGAQGLFPTVVVGAQRAEVVAHEVVLGNDRLTVRVPPRARRGSRPLAVTRADGVTAPGPGGVNVLAFEVAAASAAEKAAAAALDEQQRRTGRHTHAGA